MTLLRWDPNTFPRVFPRVPMLWDEDVWADVPTLTDGLDVYETDTEVIVKAAVPGVPDNQVNVTFEDGVLRIQGRSEESDEEKKRKKTVYKEQRILAFDYTTTLPRAVDANGITADVENGVVTVKAPVGLSARPKRITVRGRTKK